METFIAHNVVSPYRETVIDTFKRHEVPLNMEVEMPTIETIRKLVQMNMCVAFLPKMCVEEEIQAGTLMEVAVKRRSTWSARLGSFFRRNEKPPTPPRRSWISSTKNDERSRSVIQPKQASDWPADESHMPTIERGNLPFQASSRLGKRVRSAISHF